MAYVKQEWKNLPNQTTPVNATRMSHIEQGIVESNVLRNLWGNGNLYAQRDTTRNLTIPLDAGTYTFSWGELTKTSTENPLFAFYDSSNKTIGSIYLSGTSQKLILTDKAVSFRFYPAQTYDSSASQTANLKDIQLEKGSEKTSYTPYLGYITESGTNQYGNWIKYSDGTMICTRTMPITISCNKQWGSLYYGTNTDTWNFPQTFIAPPIMSIKCINTGSGSFFAGEYTGLEIGNSYFKNIDIIRPNSYNNIEVFVHCIAIGRWK